ATGRFSCGDHILLGSIRTAKTDVIADGVVEQIHILKYHSNVAQKAVAGHLPDVMASYGDASLIRIIKPGQQCAEGALPAAGRPYNGGGAVLRQLEGNIVDHLPCLVT